MQNIHDKRTAADGTGQHKYPETAAFVGTAAAQQEQRQHQHRRGSEGLRVGEEAQTGADTARRDPPQTAVLPRAGRVVAVQKQERRQRKVELLADVVRPQKPLGREGQHGQRQQIGAAPPEGHAQAAVKPDGQRELDSQHSAAHKQQHAGGRARDGGKQADEQSGRQGGQLVRLPHRVKEPVTAHKAEAEGQGVLLVNLQPQEHCADECGQRQQAQQGKDDFFNCRFFGMAHRSFLKSMRRRSSVSRASQR